MTSKPLLTPMSDARALRLREALFDFFPRPGTLGHFANHALGWLALVGLGCIVGAAYVAPHVIAGACR